MGELKVDKFETVFTYCFLEPKNDRYFELFFGIGRFLISSALPTNGHTLSPEILKLAILFIGERMRLLLISPRYFSCLGLSEF